MLRTMDPLFRFPWGMTLSLVAASFLACGGSDGTDGGSTRGGSAGASTAAGASAAGANGGASGATAGTSNGGAPTGVSGGAGFNAGASGGAGMAMGGASGAPTNALDPSLPAPSYDCRSDATTKACVSISGTLAGAALDRHCARDVSPGLLLRNQNAWPVACQEQADVNQGWFYQIAVPIREAGNFSYEMKSGDPYVGADVVVMNDNTGGDFQATHFQSGAVAGVVEVEAATGNHIITGTFRATYATPEPLCHTVYANTCAAAQVTGTFRVIHYLKVN